jgi:hypothetical protein
MEVMVKRATLRVIAAVAIVFGVILTMAIIFWVTGPYTGTP